MSQNVPGAKKVNETERLIRPSRIRDPYLVYLIGRGLSKENNTLANSVSWRCPCLLGLLFCPLLGKQRFHSTTNLLIASRRPLNSRDALTEIFTIVVI